MRIKIFLVAAVILLAMSCSYSQHQNAFSHDPKRMSNNVCVVELFTSEGCSSCPSADALMPMLKEEFGDGLIVLSFHVDYWDRLGWKDPFSSGDYTLRQNQYSNVFKADNVYTPQAIVNGSTGIVGSDRAGLEKLLNRSSGIRDAISLSAKGDGRNIMVSYDASSVGDTLTNIALVQTHTTVNVRRGENAGRQLEHYNVVRDFKTTSVSKGNLSFILPIGTSSSDFHIIAFTQHNNLQIGAAKEIDIL